MKTIFSALAAPFRWIGKFLSTTRTIGTNLIFLLIIVITLATFLLEKKPPIIHNAALVLSLAGDIVEEKHKGTADKLSIAYGFASL